MNKKSLTYGMMAILIANIVNMFFSLLTNFFMPKYLTIDAYAKVKEFLMYVSYVGVLHLGYSDGMYLRYGGTQLTSAIHMEDDIKTMRCFQLFVGVLAIAISIYSKSNVIIASALVIMPVNMTNYYRYLLQATGEFENYSRTMNISTIAVSVALMTLIVSVPDAPVIYYLMAYIVADYLIWIYLESLIYRKYKINSYGKKAKFSLSIMICNIETGFFLMLGTFSDIILTGMDRWFVRILLDSTAFAMYSFAVSMEGLMNIAVTPISTTLYNFFCAENDVHKLKKVKSKIVLFATIIVICAFPARFILETFLPLYMDSVNAIFYLFASQIFYIVIKCFHVNLYKAQKKQKKYFIKLTAIIAIGFILDVVIYAVLHTKEAFAIGTMLCGMIWFLLSERDMGEIRSSQNEIIYLFVSALFYLIAGMKFDAVVGMCIYIGVLITFSFLLMRQDVIDCIQLIKKTFEQIRTNKGVQK